MHQPIDADARTTLIAHAVRRMYRVERADRLDLHPVASVEWYDRGHWLTMRVTTHDDRTRYTTAHYGHHDPA